MCPSVRLSICVCFYLSVFCLPFCLYVSFSAHLSACPFYVYVSVCLFSYLPFVYLSLRRPILCTCQSVCLYPSPLSLSLSVCVCVCVVILPIFLPFFRLSLCLSTFLDLNLPVCPSILSMSVYLHNSLSYPCVRLPVFLFYL